MSDSHELIFFVSKGGTKSSGAAGDGKSTVFEVSKKISEYAASYEKNTLEVSKQTNACTARCGEQFDITSATSKHNCIDVNSLFSSV